MSHGLEETNFIVSSCFRETEIFYREKHTFRKDIFHGKYRYTYKLIKNNGDSNTIFSFQTPYKKSQIYDFSASYIVSKGESYTTIEPETEEVGGNQLRLIFNIPDLKRDDYFELKFNFKSPIFHIIERGIKKNVITFSDWIIHKNKCKDLKVKITCPNKLFISSFDNNGKKIDKHEIIYELGSLAKNEFRRYTVTFNEYKIWRFFISVSFGVLSMVVSGVVGKYVDVIITRLLCL